MAAIDLKYVKSVKSKGKTYYYFQHGVDALGRGGNRNRTRLRGMPMSREFLDHYYELLSLVPSGERLVMQFKRGASGADAPIGSLGWAILQYIDPKIY